MVPFDARPFSNSFLSSFFFFPFIIILLLPFSLSFPFLSPSPPPSLSPPSLLPLVPYTDIEIVVKLCNLGACSFPSLSLSSSSFSSSPFFIPVCEEEGRVEEGFEEVERRLDGERLQEALILLLGIGKGVLTCAEIEVYMHAYIYIL